MELWTSLTVFTCAVIAIVVSDNSENRISLEKEFSEQVFEGKSCLGEECQNTLEEDHFRHEKDKYYMDKMRELLKRKGFDTEDATEEDIKAILQELKPPDAEYELTQDTETRDTEQETIQNDDVKNDDNTDAVMSNYEFPKLVKVAPGKIGDEVELELQDGVMFKRITRSIKPLIFEIPDFLSPEECDHIIESARKNGLNTSNLFGAEIKDELQEERNNSDISRISDQTWLGKPEIGDEFWDILHHRLARLTQLDVGVIDRAEPMQVVSYVPGGHYHAHLDTVEANELPCCFQTRCGEKENTALWSTCCRLCRFITVLYYLNDVEEGGETVFPLADMDDELYEEKFVNLGEQKWYNLSLYCHNSSLIVKPKRGTAIFWYSHFIEEETWYTNTIDFDVNGTWYYVRNVFWAFPSSVDIDFSLLYQGYQPTGNCTWYFGSNGPAPTTTSATPPTTTTVNESTEMTTDAVTEMYSVYSNVTMTTEITNVSCLCLCPCKNKTEQDIEEFMRYIINDLVIAKNNTYKAKRRLVCANDTRWISRGIGCIGILVLTFVFGSIIIGDLKLFAMNFRSAFRRMHRI